MAGDVHPSIRSGDDRRTLVGLGFEGLTVSVAALIVAAVVVDGLRLPVDVRSAGSAALLLTVPLLALALRSGRPWRWSFDWWVELALLGVAGAVTWRLLSPAWPDLLPLGNSPDAVHHTALATYIFERHQLVRDPRAVSRMLIEFADYPPGLAVLAALAAQTFGTLPVRVIYPVAALAVIGGALGVTLLIVETVPWRVRPLAALAGLLLLLMPDYILGAVANESYYAHILAQWLIVGIAAVLVWQIQRPTPWRWLELVLLLLALTFTYTTWLPVASLVVVLSLATWAAPWRRRLLWGGAVLVPVGCLALAYGLAHANAGRSTVLVEGSTIRDPLRATGLALPCLALAGFGLGWRIPGRRVTGGLIVAALAQLAGLWMVRQRGQISGYTYYKGYYLLAPALVVPIGWLLAEGACVVLRRWPGPNRTWGVFQAALILPCAFAATLLAPALPSLAQATAHPVSSPLLEAGLWIRAHGLADDTEYVLRRPGLPAYWMHVGVLNRPRDDVAQALLREARPSFLLWYLDPFAPRTLLWEQPSPPELRAGLAVRFRNTCCVVLEKTPEYRTALQRLRPLTASYRTDFVDGAYRIDMQIADQALQPHLGVRLLVQDGDQTVASYALPIPRRSNRPQYLGFALDPRRLEATGYVNNDPASGWEAPAEPAPAQYRVLLQLLQGGDVVRESAIGACCGAAGRWELAQPHGEWLYFQPEQAATPLQPQQFGLGETLDLEGSSVDRTVARLGDTVTVRVRWNARQALNRRYVTFVHLVAADGAPALSVEGEPNGGMAPTWRWQVGDHVDDVWQLTLPSRLEPATYQVVVGMYDPASGQHLEAWRRQPYLERFWTNALPLGTVEVRR